MRTPIHDIVNYLTPFSQCDVHELYFTTKPKATAKKKLELFQKKINF